jgi:DNA-binding CsgD family transcriptional regulator
LEITRQFQTLKAGIEAHEQAVSCLNFGILSINLNAQLLYANELALSWIKNTDGLIIKKGCLHAASPEQDQQLATMMTWAKKGIGHSWKVTRLTLSPPIVIKCLPLGISETTEKLSKECHNGKILLLLSEESISTNPMEQFAKQYRLTRQEIKVLQGLAEGLSAKEIAERNHVSHNTVRTQLAILLQKTSCKTQKRLIHLLITNKLIF